jgi:pimeloyl-ACP methyl ester carboxylesterase
MHLNELRNGTGKTGTGQSKSNRGTPGGKRKICWIIVLLILFSAILPFIVPRHYLPWRVQHALLFLKKVPLSNLGVSIGRPDKEIKFMTVDGLSIAGSLYGSKTKTMRPGIILLHGNTPLGRKLAIYKILAEKLRKRGYLVLTMDFAGFGESDDPFSVGTKEALDETKDVDAAIKYFKTLINLDQDRIYVIGHSGGADAAVGLCIKDPNVQGVILIGPPRRVAERSQDPRDQDYFWERAKRSRREVYGKEFPAWFTKEMFLAMQFPIPKEDEDYLDYFSQKVHKPILLIDGELESDKDKIYLQKAFDKLSEPKEYITIENSDHYFNTKNLDCFVFYDKKVISKAVNTIDRWISESMEAIPPAVSNYS